MIGLAATVELVERFSPTGHRHANWNLPEMDVMSLESLRRDLPSVSAMHQSLGNETLILLRGGAPLFGFYSTASTDVDVLRTSRRA